ncbi:MAG: transcriptional regulator NrdR [Polyangiaceae bacterium]
MRCPFCAHLESKVTDSRLSTVGDVTRRRRECEKCAKRFTTYERVEEVLPMVAKKDGRREAFDRQKVLAGLRKACEKRPISLEQIETAVASIEAELMDAGEKEVSNVAVGEAVMKRLRELDDIAYVRFASVYRSFRDIDELREEVEKVARSPRTTSSPPPPLPDDPPAVADEASETVS